MKMYGLAMLVILAGAATAGAQNDDVNSPYFDCPYINYFDKGCPQLREAREAEERRRQQQAAEEEPPAPQTVEEAERQYEEFLEQVPEMLLPLFPKESMAPDTPALYRLLLARPTLENARRYVRWHARRMARAQVVQELVRTATREVEVGKGAAGRQRQ